MFEYIQIKSTMHCVKKIPNQTCCISNTPRLTNRLRLIKNNPYYYSLYHKKIFWVLNGKKVKKKSMLESIINVALLVQNTFIVLFSILFFCCKFKKKTPTQPKTRNAHR